MMDLSNLDGLIKYHRMMEARARTTSSLIMHFDAVQTLERMTTEHPLNLAGYGCEADVNPKQGDI